MGDIEHNEVNEIKFQYLQKSLDKTTNDLDKLKIDIKTFELDITKAIITLQTKLTIYITIASVVVGYITKFLF